MKFLKLLKEKLNVNKDFIILFLATLFEIALVLIPNIFLKLMLLAMIFLLLSFLH